MSLLMYLAILMRNHHRIIRKGMEAYNMCSMMARVRHCATTRRKKSRAATQFYGKTKKPYGRGRGEER
jgi:hypothetical protein